MKSGLSGPHTIKNDKSGKYLGHDGSKVTVGSSKATWHITSGPNDTYRFQTGADAKSTVLLLKPTGEWQNNDLEVGEKEDTNNHQTDKSLWCVDSKTGLLYSALAFHGGYNELSVQDGKLKVTHADRRDSTSGKINPMFAWSFSKA